MQNKTRLCHASSIAALLISASFLAACSSSGTVKHSVVAPKKTTEYFSEAEYGVEASPRVATSKSGIKRGGGREQIGKPYQIKGKWYHPKEMSSYSKRGAASWYGDAFHGRLTANGEIYDMTHLTAAHPTMPLPSYARVTNTANGASIVVRVNDRGPYSNGRIIDLSRRAAELLDYVHSGTADVKVEYVSRAPLHGQDDQFLMASYNPGSIAPDPSVGLPTGVMVAMNGPVPSQPVAAPFPGVMTDAPVAHTLTFPAPPAQDGLATEDRLALPDAGPLVTYRPDDGAVAFASPSLSYAPEQGGEGGAFAAMAQDGATGWKSGSVSSFAGEYVVLGTFDDHAEVSRLQSALASFGRVVVTPAQTETGEHVFALSLNPKAGVSTDAILQKAWALGATDAMTIRN